MIQDNIYARTQPSNLNQTNWDSVFLFLNDDALINMASDPKGKSIDHKRYSLVQSVLTYPNYVVTKESSKYGKGLTVSLKDSKQADKKV